jgi:dolichol-phosphate mannosyltransferase
MPGTAPDLSVVFPVYNEEENVPILMEEIARALDPTARPYEVIAVDDGSRDRSLAVLHELRTKYPQLRVLTFAKNSEEGGVDMVIGVRVNRNDTWSRRMQSRIGNGVRNWLTHDQVTDTGCSLKLVKREAVEKVKLFTGMHRFLPTLVRMQGYKVVEMPVNHRARQFGVSKYGAMNRAFRGLADCLAVRWMGKRLLKYEVHEESSEERAKGEG